MPYERLNFSTALSICHTLFRITFCCLSNLNPCFHFRVLRHSEKKPFSFPSGSIKVYSNGSYNKPGCLM